MLVGVLVTWGMTPFHDEWWFICGRSLTDIGSLLTPHNEHWVTVSAATYAATADLFGVSSETPFVVVLLVTHAVAATALYRLTDSLLATAVFIFFGAGFENLFWGFQISMVGATALGLWAMVAFVERRPRIGALLLLVGVATAGNALIFLPSIAVLLLAQRRPRELAWLLPAGMAYAAWVLLERGSIDVRGGPPTLTAVARYAFHGIVGTLSFGAGSKVAAGTAALLAIAWPRRVTPLVLAAATGFVTTFLVLAVFREGFAPADSSRYVYAAAPFLLIAIAGIGRAAARPLAVTGLLWVGLMISVILLISHGLTWPGYVAAARATGTDIPPAGVCLPHSP